MAEFVRRYQKTRQKAARDSLSAAALWGLRCRSAAWVVLLCVAGLAPLLMGNLSGIGVGDIAFLADQFQLLRAVVVTVLVWAGIVLWAVAETLWPQGVRVNSAWWLFGGFVLVAALSAVASERPAVSFFGDYQHYEGLAALLAFGAAAFLAAQLATPSRLLVLARVACLAGALVAVYGVGQAFGVDPTTWFSLSFSATRAFATWGNPDFLGGYLVFPLAFACSVALGDKRRSWRVVGAVAFVIVLAAVMATQTRGAWLAAALVLAVMVVAALRQRVQAKRTVGLLVGSVSLGLLALMVADGQAAAARITSVLAGGDSGVSARLEIWGRALLALRRSPLLGTGPDSFLRAIEPFAYDLPYWPNDAHNYFIQIAVTIGVIAAVALSAFFAAVLVLSAARALPRDGGEGRLALSAAWASAAGYLAHLMFGLSHVGSTVLLFVSLGVLLATVSPRRLQLPRAASGIVAAACALMLLAAIGLGARAILADRAYLNAQLQARNPSVRYYWAERAVRLNPLWDAYAREFTSAERAIESSIGQ